MDTIKKALESLEEISRDENAREIARVREKARLDFESEVEGAMFEGIEIGKAEGRAEGEAKGRAEAEQLAKITFLKQLLNTPSTMNMTDEELAKLRGLSLKQVADFRAS